MRTKTTLILLFLNLAVFGCILYFEGSLFEPREMENVSKMVLSPETVANIDYLEISGGNLERTHRLERGRDDWRLTEPVDWPANYYAVRRILNQLEFLEKESSFTLEELRRSDLGLADYGLEEPGMTLTLGQGDRRREIRIGAPTGLGNRLYLYDPDSRTIHIVRREIVGALATPLDELRSHSVFDIPTFEVRALTLHLMRPRDLKMRIVRGNDEWLFETPIQTLADGAAVEAAINDLEAINIRRFEGGSTDDLARYGLDNPSMQITLDGNRRSQSLLVGDKVVGSPQGRDEYYAKIPRKSGSSVHTVFTLPADEVEGLMQAQDTLRDRHFLRFDPEALTSLTIEAPGREPVSLHKLETGRWQLVTRRPDDSIRPLSADDAIVNHLTERLQAVRARSFVTDAPSASDKETYGLDSPQRTVTLNGRNEITLHLGHFSRDYSDEVYAKVEGSDFIYTVDSSIMELLPTITQHYRDRLLLSRPEGAWITSVSVHRLDRGETIVQAERPSPDVPWEEALADEDAGVRESLLELLPALRELRVRNYVLDEFPPMLTFGQNRRSWVYVIEATYTLTGGENDQTTQFELYFTDRMGGQAMFVGSPELNVVFSGREEFLNIVSRLLDAGETPSAPPESDDETQS